MVISKMEITMYYSLSDFSSDFSSFSSISSILWQCRCYICKEFFCFVLCNSHRLGNSFFTLDNREIWWYQDICASGTWTNSLPSLSNFASVTCRIGSSFNLASGTCQIGKVGYASANLFMFLRLRSEYPLSSGKREQRSFDNWAITCFPQPICSSFSIICFPIFQYSDNVPILTLIAVFNFAVSIKFSMSLRHWL